MHGTFNASLNSVPCVIYESVDVAQAAGGSSTTLASGVIDDVDDDDDEVTVVGSKSYLEDLSAEELQERLAVTSAQLKDRR